MISSHLLILLFQTIRRNAAQHLSEFLSRVFKALLGKEKLEEWENSLSTQTEQASKISNKVIGELGTKIIGKSIRALGRRLDSAEILFLLSTPAQKRFFNLFSEQTDVPFFSWNTAKELVNIVQNLVLSESSLWIPRYFLHLPTAPTLMLPYCISTGLMALAVQLTRQNVTPTDLISKTSSHVAADLVTYTFLYPKGKDQDSSELHAMDKKRNIAQRIFAYIPNWAYLQFYLNQEKSRAYLAHIYNHARIQAFLKSPPQPNLSSPSQNSYAEVKSRLARYFDAITLHPTLSTLLASPKIEADLKQKGINVSDLLARATQPDLSQAEASALEKQLSWLISYGVIQTMYQRQYGRHPLAHAGYATLAQQAIGTHNALNLLNDMKNLKELPVQHIDSSSIRELQALIDTTAAKSPEALSSVLKDIKKTLANPIDRNLRPFLEEIKTYLVESSHLDLEVALKQGRSYLACLRYEPGEDQAIVFDILKTHRKFIQHKHHYTVRTTQSRNKILSSILYALIGKKPEKLLTALLHSGGINLSIFAQFGQSLFFTSIDDIISGNFFKKINTVLKGAFYPNALHSSNFQSVYTLTVRASQEMDKIIGLAQALDKTLGSSHQDSYTFLKSHLAHLIKHRHYLSKDESKRIFDQLSSCSQELILLAQRVNSKDISLEIGQQRLSELLAELCKQCTPITEPKEHISLLKNQSLLNGLMHLENQVPQVSEILNTFPDIDPELNTNEIKVNPEILYEMIRGIRQKILSQPHQEFSETLEKIEELSHQIINDKALLKSQIFLKTSDLGQLRVHGAQLAYLRKQLWQDIKDHYSGALSEAVLVLNSPRPEGYRQDKFIADYTLENITEVIDFVSTYHKNDHRAPLFKEFLKRATSYQREVLYQQQLLEQEGSLHDAYRAHFRNLVSYRELYSLLNHIYAHYFDDTINISKTHQHADFFHEKDIKSTWNILGLLSGIPLTMALLKDSVAFVKILGVLGVGFLAKTVYKYKETIQTYGSFTYSVISQGASFLWENLPTITSSISDGIKTLWYNTKTFGLKNDLIQRAQINLTKSYRLNMPKEFKRARKELVKDIQSISPSNKQPSLQKLLDIEQKLHKFMNQVTKEAHRSTQKPSSKAC